MKNNQYKYIVAALIFILSFLGCTKKLMPPEIPTSSGIDYGAERTRGREQLFSELDELKNKKLNEIYEQKDKALAEIESKRTEEKLEDSGFFSESAIIGSGSVYPGSIFYDETIELKKEKSKKLQPSQRRLTSEEIDKVIGRAIDQATEDKKKKAQSQKETVSGNKIKPRLTIAIGDKVEKERPNDRSRDEGSINLDALKFGEIDQQNEKNIKRDLQNTTISNGIEINHQFGNYFALLIGNQTYRNKGNLETPINDVREIGKILKQKYGFIVEILKNASRREILDKLHNFRSRLDEDDNFLLYYAGHGEISGGKAYWLPVDAGPDNDTDWIISDKITNLIKRFNSKHVLVIADSCYSGAMTRMRSFGLNITNKQSRDRFLRKNYERNSRTLMSSGGEHPVTDIGGRGHSIFGRTFLETIKQLDSGAFTAKELFVNGKVEEVVAGNSSQTPTYNYIQNSGHDGGDFIFFKNK